MSYYIIITYYFDSWSYMNSYYSRDSHWPTADCSEDPDRDVADVGVRPNRVSPQVMAGWTIGPIIMAGCWWFTMKKNMINKHGERTRSGFAYYD